MRLTLGTVLLIATGVLAAPGILEPRATTNAFCAVVTAVVTKAKQQAPATTYCSSYLSIKPKVTVTISSGVTVTVTNTITSAVGATVTQTVTSGLLTCSGPKAALNKRATAAPKPSCLAAYTVAKAISSACSCLSIPGGAATTTVKGPFTTTATTVVTGLPTTTVTVPSAVSTPVEGFRLYVSPDLQGPSGPYGSLTTIGDSSKFNFNTDQANAGDFILPDSDGTLLLYACNFQSCNPAGNTIAYTPDIRNNPNSLVANPVLFAPTADGGIALKCEILEARLPSGELKCALQCLASGGIAGVDNLCPVDNGGSIVPRVWHVDLAARPADGCTTFTPFVEDVGLH